MLSFVHSAALHASDDFSRFLQNQQNLQNNLNVRSLRRSSFAAPPINYIDDFRDKRLPKALGENFEVVDIKFHESTDAGRPSKAGKGFARDTAGLRRPEG